MSNYKKVEQNKPTVSRREKIVKVNAAVNEIVKNKLKQSGKETASSLKRSINLIHLARLTKIKQENLNIISIKNETGYHSISISH